jgi:hypothetical protein
MIVFSVRALTGGTYPRKTHPRKIGKYRKSRILENIITGPGVLFDVLRINSFWNRNRALMTS